MFVAESEAEAYRKNYKDNEIVVHPDDVKGLTPKLNWMLRYAREKKYDVMVKVDDDFQKCVYLGEKREDIKPDELYETLESWSVMCLDSLTNLFTVLETADTRRFDYTNPFSLFSAIRIGFYGIILTDEQWFDERFILKQDIDFALQTMYRYKHMIVDRRYSFVYTTTMENQGGCATYRNMETEKQSIEMLRRKWGNYIFSQSKNASHGAMTVNVRNPLY